MSKESKHVKHFQQKHIKSDESVIAHADGYIGDLMGSGKNTQHNGSLMVTNLRVVFCRKGLIGEIVETIPLKNITSIERKSLLGMRRIEIHTSHDSLKFKSADRHSEQLIVDAIDNFREEKSKPSAPLVSAKSPKERLSDIKNLLAEGLLTQEEFEQKKAKILEEI